jgi:broad specificity phosphatase PhoE
MDIVKEFDMKSYEKLIVFIRHGESIGNVCATQDEKVKLGIKNEDYPLTERGREQARQTGEYIRKRFPHFSTYMTSRLERAKETLSIIDPNFTEDFSGHTNSLLNERDSGIWREYTKADISMRFPGEVERDRAEHIFLHRPIRGESLADVYGRIDLFYKLLRSMLEGEEPHSVLICGHGRWKTVHDLYSEIIPFNEFMKFNYDSNPFPDCENCSVHIWKYNVHTYNFTILEQNIVVWK